MTARSLAELALTIDDAVHGPDHPTVSMSLSDLALVLRDLGDPAAARPLLERALTIGETTWGPQHPHTSNVRGNLARLGD